jgi:hypothetical protein
MKEDTKMKEITKYHHLHFLTGKKKVRAEGEAISVRPSFNNSWRYASMETENCHQKPNREELYLLGYNSM